ncbi:odorant receptor 59a-like [Haematobia irritans]|uniref:odorant receptor 59a-like n=1 Tax=Haematobia irritans TaxID=7368 RepID=UPI003F4FB5D2
MADVRLDTKSLFRTHFACWKLLGMSPPKRLRAIYWLYSLIINIMVTVGYPLHLILGLFVSSSLYEVIQNLAITLTCTVCAMKTFAIWWRFKDVDVMFDIVKRQDERIRPGKEFDYMKTKVHPPIRALLILFYILCSSVAAFAEISLIFNGLRGSWLLMYQAYFPFEPFESKRNYAIAHIYQFIGLVYIVLQNLVNDTFAGAHLSLLGGQVHLLSMRVAKIGYDPTKTLEENNEDLLECIRDHLDLLEYRRKVEDVISLYMFFQILFSSMNMCVVLVFIILFVKDPFTMAYYFSYFIGMISEILPSCYYGTILEDEFQQLAYALFTCNWPNQNLEFKKNLRIFAEQASRRVYVTAWLFRINNNSFLTACKNSYSIFALIMNMK